MKIKKNELMLYVGIIIMTLLSISRASVIFKIDKYVSNILLVTSYVCFFINVVINKIDVKKIKIYVFLLITGTITYIVTKSTVFLNLVIIWISVQKIELKKIIKLIFIINFISIVIHMVLYSIYLLLDNQVLNFLLRENTNIIRYSFFFVHPNIFGIYVFWTIAMYYYLNFEKLRIMSYIITIFFAFGMYVFPNSKTSSYVIILLVILTILNKKNIKIIDSRKIFVIVSLFSIVTLFQIEKPFVEEINEKLNERIAIGRIIYENYGMNLFGTNILNGVSNYQINEKYYTNVKIIDSMYYTLLLNLGIIPFIVFTILILKVKNDNSINNMFLVLLLIYGISETTCLDPTIAFSIIFLSNGLKEFSK